MSPCWLAIPAAALAVYFAVLSVRERKRAEAARDVAEAARDEVRELQGGRHRDGND